MKVAHVRGHAGDVWNELADFLAKTEASCSHNLLRQDIDFRVFGRIIPYLWMILDSHCGLPPFTETGFDVQPPDLPPRQPRLTPTHDDGPRKACQLTCSLATFNVGSLFVKPDGFGGKIQYLRQQMKEHALNFLVIQEARSPPGLSMADDILRIAGGDANGHFGVELWIALKQPIAFHAGKARYLSRSHVQLLHHDPRRPVVRIACPYLDCYVMVLHAPQSGRSNQERTQWWSETTGIANDLCRDQPVFVLMDANAKTGPSLVPVVFEHGDACSGSTSHLISFLEDLQLCLPCTCDVHRGEHHTWTSPDGSSVHRIDFVAVPQTFLPCCTHSQVLHSFDGGNAHEDHIATAIQLTWTAERRCIQAPRRHLQHDRAKIATNHSKIDAQSLVPHSWTTDIETQVQGINGDLEQALQKACPLEATKPKKWFISDVTWSLRSEKLQLRKRLKQARRQSAYDLCALMFRRWADTISPQEILEADAHRTMVLCCELHLSCRFWSCTKKLKCHLSTDRNRKLEETLQTTGSQASAGALLHALKPFLGPTNPKKIKKACLPIVFDANGRICRTPEDAQNRWIQYFADMEGGQRLDHQQYREQWIEGLRQFRDDASLDLSVQEMPTLTELEAAFRRVQPGKAVGLDHVPPEICHYCPVLLARACYGNAESCFIWPRS